MPTRSGTATLQSRTPNASATPTFSPTPESPLSTPTPTDFSYAESSPPPPTATATASPTTPVDSPTPTPTAPADPSPSPTPSSTASPAGWQFDKVLTYLDGAAHEFYIWGMVINTTDSDQRIMTFWPVVQDAEGNPITSKDDVDAIGKGYKNLREGISLAPGQGLPFSFLVDLPSDVPLDDVYEMIIEAEPAEPGRDDLVISWRDLDLSSWPEQFSVEGAFENPGSDLSESVAVVVTLFNQAGQVIGVSWILEQEGDFLTTGTHNFQIEGEMWPVADQLGLTFDSYQVQVFGH